MQIRIERKLDIHFKKVIKDWVKSAENFQIFDPSSIPVIQEFERMKSIDKKYNAILAWSVKKERNENFALLKNRFLELHEKHFRFMLRKRNARQQQLLKELATQHEQELLNRAVTQEEIKKSIEEQKKYYQMLSKAAEELVSLQFDSQADDHQYQASVHQFKKLANKIEQLPKVPTLNLPDFVQNAHQIDVLEKNKAKLLHELDLSIEHCEREFAKEAWWQRIVAFFSLTRRKQLAAIKNYNQQIKSITSIQKKYSAISQWALQFIPDQSFFEATCIRPFQRAENQIRFEALGVLNQRAQNEIDEVLEIQKNSMNSQKDKYELLAKEVNTLHNKSIDLYNLLQLTAIQVMQIKEAGVFGFVRNKATDLVQSIKRLASFIGIKDQTQEAAQEVIQQISLITPNTPIEKITALAKQTQSIKTNIKAASAIEASVEKVIRDTLVYGGKANNYHFMGTTQAERVVNHLGTEQQKLSFKTIKQQSDQRAKQCYIDLEQQCVDELMRGIETQSIIDKLAEWRDAILRHRKIDGRSPTVNSERVYTHVIKPAVKDSTVFHKLGQKKLENFIGTAMHAVLNASQYDLNKQHQLQGVSTLHWEHVDTLVNVYGTKEQINRWQRFVLPRLVLPHCAPAL